MVAFGNRRNTAENRTKEGRQSDCRKNEEKKYESNDQEPTGTQSGSEYTDPAKLAIRSVHSKPPKAVALKEKPTHLTAKRGTNNYRSLCY